MRCLLQHRLKTGASWKNNFNCRIETKGLSKDTRRDPKKEILCAEVEEVEDRTIVRDGQITQT